MNSLADLGAALSERISELKRLALLRLEDDSKDLFHQDMAGLEASVGALEDQVTALKAFVQNELAAVPKVEALIEASRVQSERVNIIAANLPVRLPRPPTSSVQGVSLAPGWTGALGAGQLDTMQTGVPAAGMAMAPAVIEEASRKRKEAPRWYVTEKEFEATSSYMRGRLQPAKVNAALDELAVHAMNNAKLLSSLKGGGGKLAPAERKRATDLLHNVAGKDGIKGHFWFLDSDLREGTAIKLDKPGKSMLTLLRHLGRLQEIRCNIDGVGTTVYVMVEDPRRL